MGFVYTLPGLLAGPLLGAAVIVIALTYAPYGVSLFDTATTALANVTLQLGDLLSISTLTVLTFEELTIGGTRYPAVVPVVFVYVPIHVTVCYLCIRITDLRPESLGPDVIIKYDPFRALVLDVPGSLPLIRVQFPARRD